MSTRPGGREVGRAHVRVLPDASGFRERLATDVRRALRGQNQDVRIGVDFDSKGAAAKARNAFQLMQRAVGTIDVDMDVDASDLLREGRRAIARTQPALSKLFASMEVDSKRLAREADQAVHNAQRLLDDLEVGVDIDKAEALAEARRLEQQLEQILERTYESDLDLDNDQLVHLRRGLEGLKSSLDDSTIKQRLKIVDKRDLDMLDRYRAGVGDLGNVVRRLQQDTDRNTSQLGHDLQKLVDRAKQLDQDMRVEIDLDTDTALNDHRKLLQDISAKEVEIKADLEISEASKALALAEITAFKKVASTADIRLGLGIDKTSYAQVLREVVSLQTAIKGLRNFNEVWGDIGSRINGVGKAVASTTALVGGLGTMVAGLVPAFAAATTAAWGFLKNVGALGGALAIPAAVTAAGNIKVLTEAFQNFGTALNSADPEAQAAALEKLSPSARAAALEINHLGDMYREGSTVQESFFSRIGDFSRLEVLVQPLNEALNAMAGHWGNATNQLISFTTSGTGLKASSQLIGSMDTLTAGLSNTLANVGRGLISLGGAAAPVFEKLVGGAQGFGKAWADNLEAKFKDGSLQSDLEVLVVKIQEFWDTASEISGNLGGIIGGVFGAAGKAANGPEGIITTLTQINESVNSLSGQAALTSWFASMQSAVAAVTPILGQLFEILAVQIMPAIAGFIESAAPGFQSFFEQLGPALEPLLEKLPLLGESISNIVSNLDFDGIVQFLSAIVGGLIALTPAIEALAPWLDELALGIGVATGAFKIFHFVSDLFMKTNVFGWIVTAIGLAIMAFGKLYAENETFRNVINGSIESAKEWFAQTKEMIVNSVESAKEWFAQTKQMCLDSINDAKNWWGELGRTLADAAGAIGRWFVDRFNDAKAFVTSVIDKFNELKNNASEIFEGLKATIRNKINRMITEVTQAVAQWIIDKVQQFQDLKSKLEAKVEQIKGSISAKFNQVVSAAGTALSGIIRVGVDKFQGLQNGIIRKANEIKGSVTGFARSIPGLISQGIGNLFNSGVTIFNSFKEGILASISNAKNAVASGLQNIRDLFPFSPAKTGPFSGKGWVLYSGLSIGEAFGEGIARSSKAAADEADTMISDIAGALRTDGLLDFEGAATGTDRFIDTLHRAENELTKLDMKLDETARRTGTMMSKITGVLRTEGLIMFEDAAQGTDRFIDNLHRVGNELANLDRKLNALGNRSVTLGVQPLTAAKVNRSSESIRPIIQMSRNDNGGGIVFNGNVTTMDVNQLTREITNAQKINRMRVGAR